jgi:SAM-dependent methyltransferase
MRPGNLKAIARYPKYFMDLVRFSRGAKRLGAMRPTLRRLKPMLYEATAEEHFDTHYVYHTAWASRVLRDTNPDSHVDISSMIYFVAMVSAFVPITHYEYRPPAIDLEGLKVGQADLQQLPFDDKSIKSLSCMHVVEHVGLGRYGDRLDPLGDHQAMRELQRVLAIGGRLLFVVPVGQPRVVFNAHRVYDFAQIVRDFSELTLERFALITDGRNGGRLIWDADPDLVANQKYGCGCFVFSRRA